MGKKFSKDRLRLNDLPHIVGPRLVRPKQGLGGGFPTSSTGTGKPISEVDYSLWICGKPAQAVGEVFERLKFGYGQVLPANAGWLWTAGSGSEQQAAPNPNHQPTTKRTCPQPPCCCFVEMGWIYAKPHLWKETLQLYEFFNIYR